MPGLCLGAMHTLCPGAIMPGYTPSFPPPSGRCLFRPFPCAWHTACPGDGPLLFAAFSPPAQWAHRFRPMPWCYAYFVPVSYTHLDVYKRQPGICAATASAWTPRMKLFRFWARRKAYRISRFPSWTPAIPSLSRTRAIPSLPTGRAWRALLCIICRSARKMGISSTWTASRRPWPKRPS